MKKIKRYAGTIRWFDNYTGKGMVRLETDESVIFYGCNSLKSKSGFCDLCCVEYEKGDPITFELHDSLGAIKVSGGTFNQEAYDNADVKNSTFQLDDNGEFKNGLF